jgi:hypothetical protein
VPGIQPAGPLPSTRQHTLQLSRACTCIIYVQQTASLLFLVFVICALHVPWREYVPVAWQVDPCLALSLLGHLPGSKHRNSQDLADLMTTVAACCLTRINARASQVPWREYVPVAWQVDPCLALSLLDHFPASEPLRAALESMVVKHAADTQVRRW